MGKYVVVDLEMCKVPYDKRNEQFHWGSETIQIGAVLLDEEYQIVDEFNTYVAPEFGRLDWKISDLTGIKQQNLKSAPVMRDALMRFVSWIPEGAQVVSWSDNDLKQIGHEAESKNIVIDRLEGIFEGWIDCQKIFSEKIKDNKNFSLFEALIATDIMQEGQEHDGLVDAKNTAKLFAKLMTEPELRLNKIYENARSDESDRWSFSCGDLL